MINWQFFLNNFQYAYTSATLIIPGIILAPRVLSGDLEVGIVVQATGAFAKVFGALNVVVSKFDQLSYFTAGVGRLDRFSRSLGVTPTADRESQNGSAEDEAPRIVSVSNPQIGFENVTVQTPDGKRVLVRDLSLSIQKGQRLMIVGASGGGKSSLLRAFAGLWNSGTGSIFASSS